MTDSEQLTEVLPEALGGERIDRVVALMADVSRSEAVTLIKDGGVVVDGRVPDKPSVRVEPGSTVVVDRPLRADRLEADPEVAVDVVYEDEQVLVVDKQAHLVVHPGSGVRGGTLVNGLLARFPEIVDVGEVDRPGIVHRLDKGTSGLLMVARTEAAYHHLVQQLAARTVARRYTTLVGGLVEADNGLIDAPLGRSIRDATVRAVVADGRPARTHYEVVRRFPNVGCTQLACVLETGRTHQIRAHLTAIEHPVVADDRYGGDDFGLGLGRPFLHAAELGFEHPATGEWLFHTSALSDDLTTALETLEVDEVRAAERAAADQDQP